MGTGLTAGRLTAPFPYYGGKRRAAQTIWEHFGDPDIYVEPFAGSCATLLWRQKPCPREIVCDTDGFICNFWRAVAADPEAVARHADWPTIHQDLTARHTWLRQWGAEHAEKLSGDPRWYDPEAAGWWVWGLSIWIGHGWCVNSTDQIPQVMVSGSGMGVSVQRLGMNPGIGRLKSWFESLSERLGKVVVLNRDWESALTPTLLADTKTSQKKVRAILLDPPYRIEQRMPELYGSDLAGSTEEVANASYAWAVEHGEVEDYRIAYCCHLDDFPVPEGWSVHTNSVGAIRKSGRRKNRNAIFFSPACMNVQEQLF